MSRILPANRPMQSRRQTEVLLRKGGVDLQEYAVCGLGTRGYFMNSMGAKGRNDRGIYDDAIFLFSPVAHVAFNANVDPSIYRKGRGIGEKKGIASLKPGLWFFTIGLHRGSYTALRQYGTFTVTRDGIDRDYDDKGNGFGINIHKGGYHGTSSLGCQTIYPDQWASFIALVRAEMKRAGQKTFPYLLIENA